ncbi:MAG: hypothetical protein IT179_13490 [Acidobacteria bacterium]|nr:hypothetical protein [Acidobacteriota bacterium]
MTADAALATLDAARETCPDPLDATSERERRARVQRLHRLDGLRAELKQAQQLHAAAAARLAALERDAAPVADRLRQIAAALVSLGDVDNYDHSPEGTARWRTREALIYEQQQHTAHAASLNRRRADLVQREAEALARLMRVLADIATLSEMS